MCKVLKICLKKFADESEKQEGSVFGFGNIAHNDIDSVLKICQMRDPTFLKRVPILNLEEEKSVGLFNYEIGVGGQHNLAQRCRVYFKTKQVN